MIYDLPPQEAHVDQGDVIDSCPLLRVKEFRAEQPFNVDVDYGHRRILIVTQTCDLANEKSTTANVAEVFDAQQLIDTNVVKPRDVKGPIRGGRVWGLYFLPANADLDLGEMIVDLRRLHNPVGVLAWAAQARSLGPKKLPPPSGGLGRRWQWRKSFAGRLLQQLPRVRRRNCWYIKKAALTTCATRPWR